MRRKYYKRLKVPEERCYFVKFTIVKLKKIKFIEESMAKRKTEEELHKWYKIILILL